MPNLRKNDDLPLFACNSSLINENDQNEWANNILLERSYFKCAKLTKSPCNENYVVCDFSLVLFFLELNIFKS